MIDPLLAPPMRRVAPVAPRTQRQKRKRAKPARVSKIITAGASATALFTMVAAMGWRTSAGAFAASVPSETTAGSTTIEVVVPIAPTTTAMTPPPVSPTVATVPIAVVPVTTVPAAPAAPVVVPKAVPVTVPVKKSTKHKSNTTTKTSG